MKESKRKNILMLLCSTSLGAVGQFLFKLSVLNSISYTLLVLGVAAYFVSTIVYFFVLSRVHLSWAYGIGGLSYIFAVVLASFIEAVPLLRWVGVVVITAGVFLIGLS